MIINESKFNSYWQTKQLSELGSFRRGKSKHRPRNDLKLFENGCFPLVQTGEVKEANLFIRQHNATYNDFGLSQSQIWPENTLCITIAANIAETSLLGYPMCFPDSVVGFNAYPEESSELFMHYVFTYIRRAIQNSASGSIQDNINIEYLTGLKFKIPKKDYQDKIVSVLSAIDTKIELNNRINAELEAIAKTLYDYWFVQFDFPFDFAQGKPAANGKPYKSSGGKMVYNPILKRKIPEGWEATTIGKIAATALGGTPSTEVDEYWKNADIPWLSSAETASFPVISSDQKITQKGIESSAATLLPKGTVVISIVRYIRPSILGIDAATNQSVVGIKECSRLKSSFFYPYFCGEVPRLMGLRTGAQQPHINKGVIEESPIVLPTDYVLEEYYKKVDPIYEKIMTLAFENHELIKLRDWLLPMLMNGQVTVQSESAN